MQIRGKKIQPCRDNLGLVEDDDIKNAGSSIA